MNGAKKQHLADKMRKKAKERQIRDKFKKLNDWKKFRSNVNKDIENENKTCREI